MFSASFLNSRAYQFGALCIWFLSYFLLANTQHVINLNYLVLLVPTLLTIRFIDLKRYTAHPIVWIFIAYLLITIAAAFHSGKPASQATYCFLVILFYLTIYRLPSITTRQEAVVAWAWFSVVLVYTLFNLITAWQNGIWYFGKRLTVFSAYIDNPIYVANLLTIGLAMISFNAVRARKYMGMCIAHIFTLFLGLVILQSRSMLPVWLAVSLLTIATAFLQHRQVINGRRLAGFLIPVLLLIYILNSDTGHAILARADSYRFEIWQAYFKQTLECGLWFGCGMNDGIAYTTRDGYPIAHAHNIFVANFAKTGLVGTLLILALILTAIIYGLKHHQIAAWVLIAGTIALMFDGSSLIKSPNEKWILIHLPLAYLIKLMVEDKRLFGRQPPA